MALGGSGNINNLSGSGDLPNIDGQTSMSNFFSCDALAACDVIINIQDSITALENAGFQTIGGEHGQLQYNNNGGLDGLPMRYDVDGRVYFDTGFSANLVGSDIVRIGVEAATEQTEIYVNSYGIDLYAESISGNEYASLGTNKNAVFLYAGVGAIENYMELTYNSTQITMLAGSGTRMVTADTNGRLGTQTIPTVDWNNVTITGGTINGASLGATTPSTVRATAITNTNGTPGQVIFYGAGGAHSGSANFVWDSASNRLGIRAASDAIFTVKGIGTGTTYAVRVYNNNNQITFGVKDDGNVITQNGNIQIYQAGTNITTPSYGASNLVFRNLHNGAASYFNFHADTFASQTVGESHLLRLRQDFVPASGSANAAWLYSAPTINQTGGANGITRIIHLKPTLTSAADFRCIELDLGSATQDAIRIVGINSRIYTNGHLTVDGLVKLGSYTTTQRDALTVSNGQIIYNTTTNKFQGRAGGAWVDLH